MTILIYFLKFSTEDLNKRGKIKAFQLNKLLVLPAASVCWLLLKMHLISRISPKWRKKTMSVDFADRGVVLPTCWNSFLKSLLSLQYPAEHLPVVKIKGCWMQDFILLLLPKACKEQLMENSLVNTPSHTACHCYWIQPVFGQELPGSQRQLFRWGHGDGCPLLQSQHTHPLFQSADKQYTARQT